MKKVSTKFLNQSDQFNNGIYCNISIIDHYYPLHFHDFYEIEIYLEGEGYEVVNGVRYDLQKNSIFFFQPSDYHEIHATSPIKLYNIGFSPSAINQESDVNLLLQASQFIQMNSEKEYNLIKPIISSMVRIFKIETPYKLAILNQLLYSVLLMILGPSQNMAKINPTDADLFKYINDNFTKQLTLEQVATYSGYQKNYFCVYFKQTTNKTFKEYLITLRVEYSKKMLKFTENSIKEIAFKCGFNSVNIYIKNFKQLNNGITPKKYRKIYLQSLAK